MAETKAPAPRTGPKHAKPRGARAKGRDAA